MTAPLSITTTLPQFYVGVPAAFDFAAAGGVPPYTGWFIGQIVPNSQWETLNPNGHFTGVPVAIESGLMAIGMQDSAFPTPNAATIVLPFSVLNPPVTVPDYTDLITSEHADKPNFVALVNLLANGAGAVTQAVDSIPAAYDLGIATGAQLDVDGQWVGAPRTVFGVLTLQFFGFADNPSALTFGELTNPSIGGVFYELGQSSSSSSSLPDSAYRVVLQAKIITNQYRGTLPEVEAALTDLAGVPFQIIDPGNLVVAIVLLGFVSPVVQQLLTGSDLAPRPAGVNYEFLFPIASYSWGLQGSAIATGQTASKNGGVPAWDSAAWLSGTVEQIGITVTVPQLQQFAFGITANPLNGPNYTALAYGFYVAANGTIQLIENGGLSGTLPGINPGDTLQMVADGQYVNYLHNGAIVGTVAVTGGPFNAMVNFYTPNASLTNIIVADN